MVNTRSGQPRDLGVVGYGGLACVDLVKGWSAYLGVV